MLQLRNISATSLLMVWLLVGTLFAPNIAFACEGGGEEKAALLLFKKEKPGGGNCPAEFTVKGEKCILWVSAKKKEEINDEAIVLPVAPAKAVAFNVLKENCNGFTLEPGVANKEKCEVELQFEKPTEAPEKKGRKTLS
jgi:hypothetical protein